MSEHLSGKWRQDVARSVRMLQKGAAKKGARAELHVATGTQAGKVDGTMFFASFSCLAPAAESVTPKATVSWETYPSPVARSVWHWTSPDEQWSDVRTCPVKGAVWTAPGPEWPWKLAVMPVERTVSRIATPSAVLEARAIAKRVARPMQNERTRVAYPQFMFQRERRTLRFAGFPGWQVHYDVVSVTGGVVRAENEFVYSAGPTMHRITLSLPCNAPLRKRAPEEACELVEKIALSVGSTKGRMETFIETARQQREMAMCEV